MVYNKKITHFHFIICTIKHQAANWANRSGYPVYLYVFEHTSTNSKNNFDNEFSQRILHANDILGKDANVRQINRTSSYKVRKFRTGYRMH